MDMEGSVVQWGLRKENCGNVPSLEVVDCVLGIMLTDGLILQIIFSLTFSEGGK